MLRKGHGGVYKAPKMDLVNNQLSKSEVVPLDYMRGWLLCPIAAFLIAKESLNNKRSMCLIQNHFFSINSVVIYSFLMTSLKI